MNMYQGAGFAQGIVQGMQTATEGMVKADQIKQNRDLVRQQAEAFKMQQKASQTSQQVDELKFKMLQDQVTTMQREKTKDITFSGMRGYMASGDIAHLNNAVNSDIQLKGLLNSRGITSFQDPKKYSEEMLNKLGYNDDKYILPTIVLGTDGKEKIVDLYGTMLETGYANQFTKNEKELVEGKINAIKLKVASEEAKVSEVKAGISEDQINMYTEYRATGGTLPYTAWEKQKAPGDTSITTKTEMATEYAKLQTKFETDPKSMTPLETNLFKAYGKQLTSDSEEKREGLSKFITTTQKFITEGVTKGNITEEDVKNVRLGSIDVKEDVKTAQSINEDFVSVKSGIDLVNKVNSLSNEELQKGIIDQGVSKLQGLLSDDTFDSLSTEDKVKRLKTVQFDTQLGQYLANYIRSISGTAASQSEIDRLTTLLRGGEFNNTQTMKAAVNQFVKGTYDNYKSMLDTSFAIAPVSTIDKAYKLQALNPKFSTAAQVVNKLPGSSKNPGKPMTLEEFKAWKKAGGTL